MIGKRKLLRERAVVHGSIPTLFKESKSQEWVRLCLLHILVDMRFLLNINNREDSNAFLDKIIQVTVNQISFFSNLIAGNVSKKIKGYEMRTIKIKEEKSPLYKIGDTVVVEDFFSGNLWDVEITDIVKRGNVWVYHFYEEGMFRHEDEIHGLSPKGSHR